MTTFVTGATGFIGLNIIESLLRRGERVVLFSRRSIRPADSKLWLPPAYRIFRQLPGEMCIETGDVTSQELLETLFEKYKPDYVIHGAAITPGTIREKEQMRLTAEVNFMGALSIFEAARKYMPKRFIHLSSGSVYGLNALASKELDEEKVIPIPDSIYAITKYAAERLALRFKTLYGVDIIAVRLGTVFGPWEWDTGIRASLSTVFQITSCAFNGVTAIMPNVGGQKDWIYSRDIAAGVEALLVSTSLTSDVYNLGPGRMWALDEWCKKLESRFPEFKWRKSDDYREINCTYLTGDRAPFSTHLLEKDTGFKAKFGIEEAFNDYMEWIEEVQFFKGTGVSA